jgi:DNA-binding CsgD family transcriptional regulator
VLIMTVSDARLRSVLDGLAELYGPGASDDYPARAVSLVTRLTGVDSCSYNQFAGTRLAAFYIEPAEVGAFPDADLVFNQHLPEHPVLAYCQATGDGSARRISDFLSDRQFRSLGLYRDFYRGTDVNYQLAVSVPTPADGLIGIALNRQHRDFSDDDVELLNLLRPHFGQSAVIAGLLSQPMPDAFRDPGGAPLLTARQASIVRLVAAGLADRHIARSLGISTRTVQAHLQNIYRTLGVASRTEALARLRTLSLHSPERQSA